MSVMMALASPICISYMNTFIIIKVAFSYKLSIVGDRFPFSMVTVVVAVVCFNLC